MDAELKELVRAALNAGITPEEIADLAQDINFPHNPGISTEQWKNSPEAEALHNVILGEYLSESSAGVGGRYINELQTTASGILEQMRESVQPIRAIWEHKLYETLSEAALPLADVEAYIAVYATETPSDQLVSNIKIASDRFPHVGEVHRVLLEATESFQSTYPFEPPFDLLSMTQESIKRQAAAHHNPLQDAEIDNISTQSVGGSSSPILARQ